MLPEAVVLEARARWHATHGEPPLRSADPTDAQLTALKFIVDAGQPPYVDLAIWGPYGARQEKRMRFAARMMDTTGAWITKEISGPGSLEAWKEGWLVFETAAYMLNIASLGTLQAYAAHFVERAKRFGELWHVCYEAEARCRSEYLVTEKRRQQAFHVAHPQISAFQVDRPWNSVFAEAGTNLEYWQRELVERAMLQMVARVNEGKQGRGQYEGEAAGKGQRTRQDKDAANPPAKRARADRSTEYCFNFTRQGQCTAWPTPCPDGRLHACESCGAKGYTNAQCCKKEVSFKQLRKGKGKGRSKK